MSSLAGACVSYVMLGLAHAICGGCSPRACSPGSWRATSRPPSPTPRMSSAPEKRAASMGLVGRGDRRRLHARASRSAGLLAGQAIRRVRQFPRARGGVRRAECVRRLCWCVSCCRRAMRGAAPGTHPVRAASRRCWRLLRERPTLASSGGGDAAGHLLAGDPRVDFRDLGAASLRLRTAHRRIAAVQRGAAGARSCRAAWCAYWRRASARRGSRSAGVLVYVAGLDRSRRRRRSGSRSRGWCCAASGSALTTPVPSRSPRKQSQWSRPRRGAWGLCGERESRARLGPFTSGPIYALLGPAAPFLVGRLRDAARRLARAARRTRPIA